VDEAWAYQTPQGIPPELQTIVQSGRKRGLHLMLLTQNPNRFNNTILNGASEFVAFRLQSPPALDLRKKYYGFDPEEVSALQAMQFVARNLDSGGELRGRIKL
jgi:DNA helicase HerA-like ATPase